MYDVNYFAVIVSATAFFALGALWYNDILFGKAWRDSMGKTDKEFEKEQAESNMVVSFGLMFLGSILMAFVTAYLVDLMAVVYPNASDIMIGLQTGFWVWFGYIAAYVLTAISFENRPWKYYFINTGYWLVGALIMGVILNVWK